MTMRALHVLPRPPTFPAPGVAAALQRAITTAGARPSAMHGALAAVRRTMLSILAAAGGRIGGPRPSPAFSSARAATVVDPLSRRV